MLQFTATALAHGQRLDLALVDLCPGMSRRKIREYIDLGSVYVNQKRVRIASRVVFSGDEISLYEGSKQLALSNVESVFRDALLNPETVVFENADLLAINKPAHLPSQATRTQSKFHATQLVKEISATHNQDGRFVTLSHRLDQETTGVLLFAKNASAARILGELFKNRSIKKTYIALCEGEFPDSEVALQNHLSDIHPSTGLVSLVNAGGKLAKSTFRKIHFSKDRMVSLVACFPETGRSHQLRVHLSQLGFPILGDKKYNLNPSNLSVSHQMLHALTVVIPPQCLAPSSVSITAPVPTSFEEIAKQCGITELRKILALI